MTTESSWSVPLRVVEDLARTISHQVSEVVPPEAQMHLLSAQRELLLAVAITIEHHTSGGDAEETEFEVEARAEAAPARTQARRRAPRSTPRPRPRKVAID